MENLKSLTELMKEVDNAKNMDELMKPWKELIDTKYKRSLVNLMFGIEHIQKKRDELESQLGDLLKPIAI